MTDRRNLIALISATPVAIAPAQAAITETFDQVDVWNLLDDRLMAEAESHGGLTPELTARMRTLINFALHQGADAVLLTCSLYGPVAEEFSAGPVRVLAPDRAVFDDVLGSSHQRVLVVASFDEALADSVLRLQQAAQACGRQVTVTGVAAPAAMQSAKTGDVDQLASDLAAAIKPLASSVDAVMLAQFSLAPAQAELEQRLGLPVLSGPGSAATQLLTELETSTPRGTFGAIADDYTGAIDVADALRSAGLRTLIFFGTPDENAELPDHDSIVIALKTRSVPAAAAVAESLGALNFLKSCGVDQVYFKYCSTFDSTQHGNIGPVLDALAERLSANVVVTTPSSPVHARTVYQGNLFVGPLLLQNSHMARHPLNPMTDSYLPRVLAEQTKREVDLLPLSTIRMGIGSIATDLAGRGGHGPSFVIADGVIEHDLDDVAATQVNSPLVAGAAGFALALGRVRAQLLSGEGGADEAVEAAQGEQQTAVLAGSCSASTLEQIAQFQAEGNPSHQLVAAHDLTVDGLVAAAMAWFDGLGHGTVPLFYSSVPPEELDQIHRDIGGDHASELFEESLARIASELCARGVNRFVIAGGETSGSVTRSLGVTGGLMGDRVDDGVSWLHSTQEPQLALLLKSGNFGAADMFLRATNPESDWGTSNDE